MNGSDTSPSVLTMPAAERRRQERDRMERRIAVTPQRTLGREYLNDRLIAPRPVAHQSMFS